MSAFDLLVIGGGPAGCSAAIGAARAGASVLLLERGDFPRHKVCGEFVSAESLLLLSDLLGDEKRILTDALRISYAQIFLDHATVRAAIEPAAASIARYDLDEALWRAAAKAGVNIRDKFVVRAVEGDGPFYVSDGDQSFTSRAIINATGRWSFLTHPATRSRASSENRWIGIKAHFRETGSADSVDLYFFDGGYCGVQPVSTTDGYRIVNACAMVRADVASSLPEVFELHPALQSRSRNWKLMMNPVTTSPLVFHQPEPVRGNMLQAGDAATFVDPFIGDGISLALRSGSLAAQSLQSCWRAERPLHEAAADYARKYAQDLAPVFRASTALRVLLRVPRLIRRPVLAFLQHTPTITSQLVKLTR